MAQSRRPAPWTLPCGGASPPRRLAPPDAGPRGSYEDGERGADGAAGGPLFYWRRGAPPWRRGFCRPARRDSHPSLSAPGNGSPRAPQWSLRTRAPAFRIHSTECGRTLLRDVRGSSHRLKSVLSPSPWAGQEQDRRGRREGDKWLAEWLLGRQERSLRQARIAAIQCPLGSCSCWLI